MSHVLIHPYAGVLCAYGMGIADVKKFGVRTVLRPLAEVAGDCLETIFAELESDLRPQIEAEGVEESSVEAPRRSLELRYVGQSSEIEVVLSIGADPDVWSWSIEFDAMGSAADAMPDNYSLRAAMCYNLLMTGYREEALHCGRRLIQLEPLAPLGYWRTGLALSALGRREEARASFQKAIDYGQSLVAFYAWDIALDYLIAKEFEAAIEVLKKTPATEFWNPEDARLIVESAADPGKGKAFLDDWIGNVANTANYFSDVNAAYFWYLAFGHVDDYWQQIEDYEAQTDSAWTMADELEIRGTAFPSLGYTRHPQYVTNGIKWGLTELWDERGPPDMCNKSTGQWVCE